MNTIHRLSAGIGPVLLALSLAACAQGKGGNPDDLGPYVDRIHLRDKFNTPVPSSMGMRDAAHEYMATQYEIIGGLSERDEFVFRTHTVGMDGYDHVRLDQVHDGVRVWGADIVVHSTSQSFRSVNGTVVKGLEGFDTTPSVSEAEALAISQEHYVSQAKEPPVALAYERESIELVIAPLDDRTVELAWQVRFYTELQAGMSPGLWNYFVDARTGAILAHYNDLHSVVQASGPGGNERIRRDWDAFLDVNDLGGGRGRMETPRLRTVDMSNATSGPGTVVEGDVQMFGDPASNDAHAFAKITLDVMKDWFGYDSLDDEGMVVQSRVHYGVGYENAFWDGLQMTYGDGGSFFYSLSGALDVVAHELHHGFTAFHSGLIYRGQSGAINESFSDIAGTIAEFYWRPGEANWEIGNDILRDPSTALRYLCDPTRDGASIDHADDYHDELDVHHASGVPNKAFCHAARRLTGGDPAGTASLESVRRAGMAWYLANASYWNASASYQQACQGVMDAAAALGFSAAEIDAINRSWQDVGVFCDGAIKPLVCTETLTSESGTLSSPNHPSPYPNNFRHTWCIAPASGEPATLTFSALDTEKDYDVVEIKDANSNILARASGAELPGEITSTLIAVTFTSDSSITGSGFAAEWSTGTVQNTPPTAEITAPDAGSQVSGMVTVSVSAADEDGTVARVIVRLPDGSEAVLTDAPYAVTWDTTKVDDGDVTIRAVAVDELGTRSAEAAISVQVANGSGCASGVHAATDVPINIPDYPALGIVSDIEVSGEGVVASLSLSVNITHPWRGDLTVALFSPSDTLYLARYADGTSGTNLVITNRAVNTFAGEPAAGTWSLLVLDEFPGDVGRLNSWSLDITASCVQRTWSASDTPNMPTVDNGEACTTVTVTQPGNAADVLLDIEGSHTFRSSLRGTLEHNGVTVPAFPADTFPRGEGAFELVDRRVSGLSGDARGEWKLCIVDTDAFDDVGVLRRWSVHD